MNVLQHNNLPQFLAGLTKIRNSIHEWRLVSVMLEENTKINVFSVTKTLWDMFKATEGDLLICNSRELLALIKTGKNENVATLQTKIQQRFPDQGITTGVTETTKEGLQKIELKLQAGKQQETSSPDTSLMLKERARRGSNVILIVEDDMFQRSLAIKAMEPYGTVMGLDNGKDVVETYLKMLPNVVFLDIHLPGQSGVDILSEILMFDQDAYVIMLSADSGKENVISTRDLGAKGFIAKPFTREKLEEMFLKCPTIVKKK